VLKSNHWREWVIGIVKTVGLRLFGFIMGLAMSFSADAQENAEARKPAILTAISESAVSQVTLIKERLGSDGIAYIGITSDLTDRDFRLRLDGKTNSGAEIIVVSTGAIWGTKDDNLDVSFGGLGHIGKDPLRLNVSLPGFMTGKGKTILALIFDS
jgi:hypothetical protein